MIPYCFKCDREMQCLKTGFTWVDHAEHSWHSDLFYCPDCKSMSTNEHRDWGRITPDEVEPNLAEIHYRDGKFTEKFIADRLTWYSGLFAEDFSSPHKN